MYLVAVGCPEEADRLACSVRKAGFSLCVWGLEWQEREDTTVGPGRAETEVLVVEVGVSTEVFRHTVSQVVTWEKNIHRVTRNQIDQMVPSKDLIKG